MNDHSNPNKNELFWNLNEYDDGHSHILVVFNRYCVMPIKGVLKDVGRCFEKQKISVPGE